MEAQVSPSKIGFRYGIIAAIISIIYSLILQLAGLASNQALSSLGLVILAIVIYLAHKAFKEQGDGFMKYGQGVSIGFIISLVSGVIGSIFMYIYISFIDDSVIQQGIDKAYQDLEERGMSDEEIEQAMQFTEKLMTPMFFLIVGIVFTIIAGLIISLIISGITKKENPQAV